MALSAPLQPPHSWRTTHSTPSILPGRTAVWNTLRIFCCCFCRLLLMQVAMFVRPVIPYWLSSSRYMLSIVRFYSHCSLVEVLAILSQCHFPALQNNFQFSRFERKSWSIKHDYFIIASINCFTWNRTFACPNKQMISSCLLKKINFGLKQEVLPKTEKKERLFTSSSQSSIDLTTLSFSVICWKFCLKRTAPL